MTKKEATTPPPLECLFEMVLDGRGLFMDSTDWKELRYACHVKWLQPLIQLQAIEAISSEPAWPDGAENRSGRPAFNYHKFRPTPAGMAWWVKERTSTTEAQRAIDMRCLLNGPRGEALELAGKGIGSQIFLWWHEHIDAGIMGIRDGYFDFVSHDNGHPSFWRMDETLKVSLTHRGLQFFASLPRLNLECA